MTESCNEPTGRLVSHFAGRSHAGHTRGWSELWESDQSGFWDRGKPSPALIDFVESRPEVLHPPPEERRLRALVPGCGKGYDVAMLALHGFDVYGLEVSEKGAQVARSYVASELVQPNELNYANRDEWLSTPRGAPEIITGDFFKRDWQWQVTCTEDGVTGFDLIYDYTFLCAILPGMRKNWARRMGELLAPGGVLICLEFPLYKDLNAPGPPWGLRGVHWNLLAQGEDGILDGPVGEAGPTNGRFDRVLYLKPPRSYENGKGTDMLSVWALKS
ncbi:thiopurine s-methyltransferase (TPMT) domain-containing protein [Hirsutella rhossiliensis]|uniref:Thiopurine s-methyltransferase (TPMT) domain-containing protein n=1 Tax=Hirsutella rhossiliensis TaxID=111463 RepID=A0A9P8N3K6_9HYPO|nr:thiopurine s-methyltransferase (TPMT) domain-containing protein [Hirsutella rhossiliensis]KAH0967703.1 thiopurine s-methyltransferase (TPMT) domain-containing protein [Hirsutella rhossiliensis]